MRIQQRMHGSMAGVTARVWMLSATIQPDGAYQHQPAGNNETVRGYRIFSTNQDRRSSVAATSSLRRIDWRCFSIARTDTNITLAV